MELIKRIALITLFIQYTTSIRAMDCFESTGVFNQIDIMGRIVQYLGEEKPFTDFWNFCSTNKGNYKEYKDNVTILKQIAYQSKYLNGNFPFATYDNPITYRMLLTCVETDLPQLMGISRTLDHKKGNCGSFFEIKYETSLDMHEVFQQLVKIRTLEKKIDPNGTPFDEQSIFSLETRKILWDVEGATLVYLRMYNEEYSDIKDMFDSISCEIESEVCRKYEDFFSSESGYNLAFKYMNIIFPLEKQEKFFEVLKSLEIYELYWLTMLARDFFHSYPEIALIFSLSLGVRYKVYLNLENKDKPFEYALTAFSRNPEKYPEISSYMKSDEGILVLSNLKEQKKHWLYGYNEYKNLFETVTLSQETFKKNYPFNERYFIDKNVFLKRKECLEFALQEIPSAWNLYEKKCSYGFCPEEILGIPNPNIREQLPN